ncbi:oligosaccharide flippase family protein [Branchiibius cervicis]|uniref:Oligosaccharide flippase family protein n=1 Tax=Branchiibius cervicis TaxID=908252 RepID=A0ABW2ATC6_9MICO
MSAALGVAMGVANAVGYLVVLLLSRSLGASDFGGYSALSAYGVLLSIPAGAFQVIIARRIAMNRAGEVTSGLRATLLLSALATTITVVLAPVLAAAFHLSSLWAVVLLAAMLPGMLITGCLQGILLGSHRLPALASLYVVTAVTRLIAAFVAAAVHADVTGVMAAMLTANVLTVLVGGWLCRRELRTVPTTGHALVREMLRSNSSLAAFIALTNVDVLLARHFLSPHESGGYALASTFARAIFWGTQFIALIVVPRMHRVDATRALLRATGLVVLIGLTGFAIVAINPRFWVTAAGGPEYAEYGPLALACVLLGIAWALAQLWLFSEMSRGGAVLGALTWVVTAAQIAVIALWMHGSGAQIALVCGIGATVIAVGGLVELRLRR